MRRKILLFAGGCLALLFILLAAFLFLLPYLADSESMREKVQVFLFQQVGGRVEYQKMDLFYFPRIGVEIHQVRLSIDEQVAGSVKSVQVYPELLPLLQGKLRVTRIQVDSPDFTIQLPMEDEGVKEKPPSNRLKEFGQIVARVAGSVPSLKVVMKGGRLNLVKRSKTVLSFNDIDANMTGPSGKAKIEITCRSNLWERMSVEATINPADFKGSGRIEMAGFHPHLLSGLLFPDDSLNITDSQLHLKIAFETKGPEVFQAALEGFVPRLTFVHGEQKTGIRGKGFRAFFQMEGERIDVSLNELDLEYPRLTLSGRFKIDQKAPLLLMEVQGRELDVVSTREVTLRLAGKIPVMNTIFDIVRGGRIPLITFQSQGRRMSDLDDTERFFITGNILDGEISIPVKESEGDREDFTLMKAAGDVVISRGILEGKNLRARWKNQPLQEGKLRVGLEGEDAPFHLEIGVETDLALLPPLLSRVIKDQVLREEIARLRRMQGRAAGKLVLGKSLKSIDVKADVQEVNLGALHDRIPYPIAIDGGAVSFDGERLRVRNLSGMVGTSSFSALTGWIDLGKEPSLEISSGNSVMSLEEIYAWLSSHESMRGALKDIRSMKGKVTLSGMRLSGPLMRPGEWNFETAGDLKGLVFSTPLLPEPFAISSGKFNLYPRKITIADLQTKFLSSSLNVSGALFEYQRGLERAELSLSGRVAPRDAQWLSNALGLKHKVQLRSSVRISRAQLSWRKGAGTGFKGDLAVQNGPEISLDVLRYSHGIKVNHLAIRDDLSDASIRLDIKGRAIDVTFSGRLSEKTLDAIFTQFQPRDGWVRGDFQAHVDVDQPPFIVAYGKIELNHLSLPSGFGRPLEIDGISVNARGDRMTVDRANFVWGGKGIALSGDVSFSDRRILLDLDLFAESFDVKADLDTVREILSMEKKDRKDEGLQVQGTVRFKTESLLYDRFAWRPFYAEVMFDPYGAGIVITEANLCGISTPGIVKITNQSISVDLQPFSRSQGLQSTFSCFFGQEMRVEGDFDLKARVFAQGKPEDLIRSLKGNVEFQAKQGHVYYSIGLMRIVEFVNATEIYRGKLPDLRKEGLEYDFAKIRGSFQNGKFIIQEATLDGTGMELVAKGEVDLMSQELNLVVLVAPLKTVDRIIRLNPLVREIFAGSLIAIPMRVRGNLKDPKVTALSPSAVGDEILGMMKRTLGLPFKLIEPLMPRKKEDRTEEK